MIENLVIASGIGIILSALFALLILQKKQKSLSDFVLFFWFLMFALHLALIWAAIYYPDSPTIPLAKSFGLIHGPLLYIYTQSLSKERFSIPHLLHLLPFFCVSLVSLFISPQEGLGWEVILLISKSLSLIAYPLYVLFWLRKNLEGFKQSRADNFLLDSLWIKRLCWIFIIYALLGILHVLVDLIFELEFSILIDLIFYVGIISIIGYYGLRFQVVFEAYEVGESLHKSYANSPLSSKEMELKKREVKKFFAERKDYLEPDFSLTKLSEKLDIPRHHLSELINQEMGSSFYDLVNERRIGHAIELMKAGKDMAITLEALGYDCGFNTKSAFYHHFKQFTGKTPGQFRKEIRSD
ncbi:MAG: helix-turn-helix domain-containing protein [Bacteroidota bacterium]